MRTFPASRQNASVRTRFFKHTSRTRLIALASCVLIVGTVLTTSSSAQSLGRFLIGKTVSLVTRKSEPTPSRLAATSRTLNAGTTEEAPQSPSGMMTVERSGHTATRLSDGRVLIAGGQSSTGVLNQTEIYDAVNGTFSAAANMSAARADHSATLLSDGRVLISGGRNGAGALASTEIFDPASGAFTNGPNLSVARSGQSATQLSDGRILIAGGDSSGSAEVLDASLSSWTPAGPLGSARSMHSAALLQDGSVLIVGGRDSGGNALSSGEIFNGSSFSPVAGDLNVPRTHALLRVLFDGKVQVIGGSDDGSMEIYDPQISEFGAYAHVSPEGDTCASLPAQVQASQTRAALFHNSQSDATFDRSSHSITELGARAIVVGGVDSGGTVLGTTPTFSSSAAAITTDKLDYIPGETAHVAGRGFQPGETVRVKIHEDPHTPQERGMDVVADGAGNFLGDYLVKEYDLNMKFLVGAKGLTSGLTAQTTFTDARNLALTFAGTGTGTVTITPSTGTVNAPASCGGTGAAAATQTVFGTCSPNITVSDNGATVTFSAATTGGSTFAGWSAPANLSSSTCTGTANPCSAVLGGNPGLTVTFNGSIDTTLTLAAPSPASVQFGSTGPVTVSATLTRTSGGAAVSGALVNFTVDGSSVGSATANVSGIATISTYDPAALTVGGHNVQASSAQQILSGTTYAASTSGTQTLTVTKADQTITFGALANKTYGDADFTVSATASSGLAVSFASQTTGVCTVSGSTVHIVSAGACTIRASQPGNTNYNAAPNVDQSFTVNQKSVTASVTATNKTYDGNNAATITNCSLTGVVAADTANVTCSAAGPNTFADANVANGKTVTATNIALSGSAAGNYSLSSASATTTANITTKALTATLTADDKVYDGDNSEPDAKMSCSVSGVLAADTANVLCTATSGTFNSANVTTANQVNATVIISGTASGNYTLGLAGTTTNSTAASATAHITPKTLTASIIGTPTKPYDGNTNATLTSANFSLTGLVSTESFTVTKTTGSYNDANVALATTVSTTLAAGDFTPGSGTLASNYVLPTTASGAGAISKKTLTASIIGNPTKPYDGNANATLSSANFSLTGLVGTESFTVTKTTGTYNDANAAAATTVSTTLAPADFTAGAGTQAGNYDLPNSASGAGTITRKTLTASIIGNPTKPYDGNTNATLTSANFNLSGVVGTESFTVTKTTGTYNDANVALAITVSTTLAPGDFTPGAGTQASNYDLPTSASGPGTITKATPTVTVSFAASSVTYDGLGHPASVIVNGVSGPLTIPADGTTSITYTRNAAPFAGTPTDAGNYTASATFTSANGNYNNASSTTDALMTIEKRDATWTTNANSKTYGDADPNPLTTGSGDFLAADNVTAAYSRLAGETVLGGPYHITASLSPAAVLSNYNVTNAGNNFTINARNATWTTNANSKTYGDADPNPLTTGSCDFLAADNVTATYSRVAGETVLGGPYHITATLSPAAVLSNYNVTNDGNNFSINVRNATWTTNPGSKIFNNPDPSPLTTGSGSNFIAADNVTATYSRVSGGAVGGYHITASLTPLTALSNYSITNLGSTFTITNVAPSNVWVSSAIINENGTASISGGFDDPDSGQVHSVTIIWGDGSSNTTVSLGVDVKVFGASHQYLDDDPTATTSDIMTVSVSVTDGAGSASGGSTVTVNNVAPVLTTTSGPTTPQPVGSTTTFTASFSDVGSKDTHKCSFNWDDSSSTNNVTPTETDGNGSCSATHIYSSPGVYSASVTVTDDDSGSGTKTLDLFIVIFDPNAGFVTGGGWIMSPAGACQLTPACTSATGKSNFGFVSKYKKGSNTPEGQTEFQFQAGDLNFHSSDYDFGSLVVSGYKAQYRGTGDINGVPGYKFILTAYDGDVNGGGGVDRFRIKITKNGTVVYDNRIGSSDDIDLADPIAIGGGSIVIHK